MELREQYESSVTLRSVLAEIAKVKTHLLARSAKDRPAVDSVFDGACAEAEKVARPNSCNPSPKGDSEEETFSAEKARVEAVGLLETPCRSLLRPQGCLKAASLSV